MRNLPSSCPNDLWLQLAPVYPSVHSHKLVLLLQYPAPHPPGHFSCNYHPNKELEGLEQTFQLVSLPVGNSSLQSLLYRHTDFPGYTLYCEV